MLRRRDFSKKRRFLQFFVSAPKKFSNGCQSDNFRRSAHGSSESSCPKFSETHAEKVSIFKIVGASPLQSQVIQKSCRQNRWFSGTFWEKILSHGQTVHFRPHSVIYHLKAMHHSFKMSYLEPILVHPVRRQIFGDTSGQTFYMTRDPVIVSF